MKEECAKGNHEKERMSKTQQHELLLLCEMHGKSNECTNVE